MSDLIQQFSQNAASLSILFFVAAVFLTAFAWSMIAVCRMLQIAIATNISLSRELSMIRNMVPAAPGTPVPQIFPSIQETTGTGKNKRKLEGEAYTSEDSTMAEIERVRQMQTKTVQEQGLTDEELNARVQELQQLGFNENA